MADLFAVTKDAKYDHIIVPTTKQSRASVPRQTRREVISAISGCAIEEPLETTVDVLTKAEFEALGNALEQKSHGSALHTALGQLQQTVPSRFVELYLTRQGNTRRGPATH